MDSTASINKNTTIDNDENRSLEMSIRETEEQIAKVDAWLMDKKNIRHPRWSEGFDKLKALIDKRGELFLQQESSEQIKLF